MSKDKINLTIISSNNEQHPLDADKKIEEDEISNFILLHDDESIKEQQDKIFNMLDKIIASKKNKEKEKKDGK